MWGIAILTVLVSMPLAWQTLELANQEYLHLWNSRRVYYDVEFNGAPVSNADAIRYGAIAVIIHWTLAVALVVVLPFVFKRVFRKSD